MSEPFQDSIGRNAEDGDRGASYDPVTTGSAAGADPHDDAPPHTVMDVSVGGDADEVNVAETINQFFTPERPRLASGHFERYDMRLLAEHAAGWLAPGAVIDRSLEVLERRRVLFLTGEAESGKSTIARRLAAELAVRHSGFELWLCRHGLDRNVQVRIDDLSGPSYQQRFLIFRDPLEHENADLTHFVRDLDAARAADLGAKLARHRTFLVFTADHDRLAQSAARLRSLGILVEVGPLPGDLLVEGLHQAAVRVVSTARAEVARYLSHHDERIVESLKTMPRIVRFVHGALLEVVRGEVQLDIALQRMDSLESWLLRELPEDFVAWCYVLALVLCHAAIRTGSLAWIDFDLCHHEVVRHFERQLRISRQPRSTQSLCRESDLCRAARAEIRHPGFPEPCTIRFRNAAYPAQLWRILLGPGRALLGRLRPLIETFRDSEQPFLRTLAAQLTGRMGELAPYQLVIPLLDKDATPLGSTFQGILQSEDERYRARCVLRLRDLTLGSRPIPARNAIHSLVEIGQHDLDLALAEIRAVCEHEFGAALQPESFRRQIDALHEDGQDDMQARQRLARIKAGNPRDLLAAMLPRRGMERLDAVRYALVGLSLTRGPIEVLSRLDLWCADGSAAPSLRALLAILLLRSRGLLDYLESAKLAGDEDRGRVYSPILAAARPQEERAALASHLLLLHRLPATLPGLLRQGLQARWSTLLKGWANQVEAPSEYRETLLGLFRQMLAATDSDVRTDLVRLLRRDPDFSRSGSDLATLAADALLPA